jgi:hypothetical protein
MEQRKLRKLQQFSEIAVASFLGVSSPLQWRKELWKQFVMYLKYIKLGVMLLRIINSIAYLVI